MHLVVSIYDSLEWGLYISGNYSRLQNPWSAQSNQSFSLRLKKTNGVLAIPNAFSKNCEIAPTISPLFRNIFNVSLTSGVKLHIHLWNVVVRFIFCPQIYVNIRIFRGISESPLVFEITSVDYINLQHWIYVGKKTYIALIFFSYSI